MRWTYQKRFHRQVATGVQEGVPTGSFPGSNACGYPTAGTGEASLRPGTNPGIQTGIDCYVWRNGTDISNAGSYLTFASRIHHSLLVAGGVSQTSFRPNPSLRVRTTDGNMVPIRTFWPFWTAS